MKVARKVAGDFVFVVSIVVFIVVVCDFCVFIFVVHAVITFVVVGVIVVVVVTMAASIEFSYGLAHNQPQSGVFALQHTSCVTMLS